jgi:ethanolaminephosphotransferase
MWLHPNMVTLLGFFFILGNIGLLVIFMPDLVGPVSTGSLPFKARPS